MLFRFWPLASSTFNRSTVHLVYNLTSRTKVQRLSFGRFSRIDRIDRWRWTIRQKAKTNVWLVLRALFIGLIYSSRCSDDVCVFVNVCLVRRRQHHQTIGWFVGVFPRVWSHYTNHWMWMRLCGCYVLLLTLVSWSHFLSLCRQWKPITW